MSDFQLLPSMAGGRERRGRKQTSGPLQRVGSGGGGGGGRANGSEETEAEAQSRDTIGVTRVQWAVSERRARKGKNKKKTRLLLLFQRIIQGDSSKSKSQFE